MTPAANYTYTVFEESRSRRRNPREIAESYGQDARVLLEEPEMEMAYWYARVAFHFGALALDGERA